MVKQVIVMRKDLNMRKGKLVAQGAHASLGALLEFFYKGRVQTLEGGDLEAGQIINEYKCEFGDDSVLGEWLNGIFTKICLYVNSESEIKALAEECEKARSPYKVITDSGLTEFHGIPTITCIGIGPYYSEEIDKITGNLPLL